jgi:hypothetical protein
MGLYFSYIIHFFISLLIGGLFCIGLWISRGGEMNEDGKTYKWRMILFPFYQYMTKKFGEWAKPIIGCYKCYASFWGTIIYWTMTVLAIRTNLIVKDFHVLILLWIIYCFSLVVVNVLLEKITSTE